MRSRLALAAVALAVLGGLAGCGAAGSLEMHPANGTDLADRASRPLAAFDHPGPEGDRRAAAVRTAVANGSAEVTALSPPVAEGLPVVRDGRYYDLSVSVVGRREVTMVGVEVDYNATNASGAAVAYEDLPAPDRAALGSLFPPDDDRRVPGPDAGVGASYTDAELDASVLAPDPEYDVVVYRGERYPVSVDDPRTATEKTYRYTTTLLAENATAYAAQLREQYAVTLSTLSAGERDVLRTAAEEGSYYAESDDDDAFGSLVARLREREAVTRDAGTGTWLVRFRGDLYLADVRFGPY